MIAVQRRLKNLERLIVPGNDEKGKALFAQVDASIRAAIDRLTPEERGTPPPQYPKPNMTLEERVLWVSGRWDGGNND